MKTEEKPAVRQLLRLTLPSECVSHKWAVLRRCSSPVFVEVAGMWESPQRFPRAVGWVENSFIVFHAFHRSSFPPPLPVTINLQAAAAVTAWFQSCSNLIGLT